MKLYRELCTIKKQGITHMLIKEILNKNPETIHPNVSIKDAVKRFINEHINGFIVVDEKKKVLGILALQDVAAATIPEQFKKNVSMAAAMYKRGFFTEKVQEIQDKPVSSIMRKNFETVNLEDNIMAVTADFLKNDLYIVPVISEDQTLMGIITRSEIKHALAHAMGLPSHYWKEKGQ